MNVWQFIEAKDRALSAVLSEYGMALEKSVEEIKARCEIQVCMAIDPSAETLLIDGKPVLKTWIEINSKERAMRLCSARLDEKE